MNEETFEHYMDALDEIHRLRKALAYEAELLEEHMKLKKFPNSRRPIAIQQVERMRGALDSSQKAYDSVSGEAYAALCKLSPEVHILTRRQWEMRNKAGSLVSV